MHKMNILCGSGIFYFTAINVLPFTTQKKMYENLNKSGIEEKPEIILQIEHWCKNSPFRKLFFVVFFLEN